MHGRPWIVTTVYGLYEQSEKLPRCKMRKAHIDFCLLGGIWASAPFFFDSCCGCVLRNDYAG